MDAPFLSDYFTSELDPIADLNYTDVGVEMKDCWLDEANIFQYSSPDYGEHLPGYAWYNLENDSYPAKYAESCPYQRNETSGNFSAVQSKFRLVEELSQYE
jgi:hypothetical protein